MRDPSVSFYKPFQSGEGVCYPAFPWNYYDTKYTPQYDANGGKKRRNNKKGGASCNNNLSYANGVDMSKMSKTELDVRKNFGPFLYPPNEMPMNPHSGGKKTGRKSKQAGGNVKVGTQYLTQPLVPTNLSTPADYVGDAYLTSPNQKNALTGEGVAQPMNPLTEEFLNNNMGVTYATQAGGAKKKTTKKSTTTTKKPTKKTTTKKHTTKKGGSVDERLTGSNSPINMNRNTTCGGNRILKGGDKEMKRQEKQMLSSQDAMSGIMVRANKQTGSQTGGMDILYRNAGKVNTPSNFSDGDIWHPEWSYDKSNQKGGKSTTKKSTTKKPKSKVKKGGNYIPTPDAQFSSIPAGAEVQMGVGEHIIKGGPALKGMGSPINIGTPENPGVQTQMAADQVDMETEMFGGSKKKSSTKKTGTKKTATKKTATKKTPAKKTSQKKKTPKRQKGGVSDFATTLASRGPANYPDGPSQDRFRFFNKTGTYIPNSMLKFAAAPVLTGYSPDPNPYPVAYNEYCGGNKKNSTKKSKK